MSRATPKMREFATHLIACETRERGAPETQVPATIVVCERFGFRLTTIMGKTGVQALLLRALALASAETPRLRAVHLKADGSLEGWEALEAIVGPGEVAQAGLVLVAHFLGLLAAFIGEDLTLHLAREVWPELSLDASDFSNTDENEKAS
jgi:hypothetical protein